MKTALQELIEWIDKNKENFHPKTMAGEIYNKATELGFKEKQQLIDAIVSVNKNEFESAEDFYNNL